MTWILTTRLGRAVAALLALLAAVATFGRYKRGQGRREAEKAMRERDAEHAMQVRRWAEAAQEKHDHEIRGLSDSDLDNELRARDLHRDD